MILSRKTFEYQGKALIEKIVVEPPYRHEVLFHNEGCFLHISGAETSFGAPDQRVNIQSRESVLLNCGRYVVDWLSESSGEVVQVYAIHLFPSMLKSLYENDLSVVMDFQQKGKAIKKVVSSAVVSKFIEGLDFYFDHEELVNEEMLKLKIKELILLLIQTRNATSILQLFAELFTPRKATLREVIHEHLYANLSLDELARLSGMSLSTFKREFKSTFDDTPTNYIKSKKMEKASQLLKLADLSVSQVAFEVGFSDPAYFSRAFRKHFGQAPKTMV